MIVRVGTPAYGASAAQESREGGGGVGLSISFNLLYDIARFRAVINTPPPRAPGVFLSLVVLAPSSLVVALVVGGFVLRSAQPSNAGVGMGRMGGLSSGRLESSRLPSGPPGLNRGGSADSGAGGGRSTRGQMTSDPRKQFKTLKSTAFLA